MPTEWNVQLKIRSEAFNDQVILWEQFRYFNLFKSICLGGKMGGNFDIFSFLYLEIWGGVRKIHPLEWIEDKTWWLWGTQCTSDLEDHSSRLGHDSGTLTPGFRTCKHIVNVFLCVRVPFLLHEASAEEEVGEVDVADHYDQVENLAHQELKYKALSFSHQHFFVMYFLILDQLTIVNALKSQGCYWQGIWRREAFQPLYTILFLWNQDEVEENHVVVRLNHTIKSKGVQLSYLKLNLNAHLSFQEAKCCFWYPSFFDASVSL